MQVLKKMNLVIATIFVLSLSGCNKAQELHQTKEPKEKNNCHTIGEFSDATVGVCHYEGNSCFISSIGFKSGTGIHCVRSN